MKGIFKLLIVIIIVLSSCTENASKKEEVYHKEGLDVVDKNQLNNSYIKNMIITDSLIKKTLLKDEEIIVNESLHLLDITDEVVIWLVPLKDFVLKKYLLVLLDTDTKSILSFIKIKGVWIDNDEKEYQPEFRFLTKPLIYTDDTTHDGEFFLIIKDRQHIGNTYNAAVKHFFSLNNMNIKYLGEFEYISHLPVDNKFLVRYWNNQTKIVNVFIKDHLQLGDSLKVGSYDMSIENDTLDIDNPKTTILDYEKVLISTK